MKVSLNVSYNFVKGKQIAQRKKENGKVLQDYAGHCFMKVQAEKDWRELLKTQVKGQGN